MKNKRKWLQMELLPPDNKQCRRNEEENHRGKDRKGKSDRGRAKSHAGNEI